MSTPQTKEKQYSELLDVKNSVGLTSLGVMTNQVWHDDPRRLTFLLSRYKFVSKMFAGKANVAELGCGDAFGSRIVQQDVKALSVFDFDPLFIADVNERKSAKWPFKAATVHDALTGPLPGGPFDGIYSLDVMEHIPAADENTYLTNIKKSLAPHGAFIVGMPSLESQTYASPQSKIGHINCKSGNDFKAVLSHHFGNVFLFSMNDEVVHTGFSPMAHYLIGLCVEPR
jgi:2-polyprenyl-3-methyl-5-hydroxy-6-metoxy-1,4-benzoquinol methylase